MARNGDARVWSQDWWNDGMTEVKLLRFVTCIFELMLILASANAIKRYLFISNVFQSSDGVMTLQRRFSVTVDVVVGVASSRRRSEKSEKSAPIPFLKICRQDCFQIPKKIRMAIKELKVTEYDPPGNAHLNSEGGSISLVDLLVLTG